MRSKASAEIKFGVISIPVKVYKAVESKKINMQLAHVDCNGEVGQSKYCKKCKETLTSMDIVSAYKSADGSLTPFTKEELNEAFLDRTRIIQIQGFTDARNFVYGESNDYISTDEKQFERAYWVLASILDKSKKVAVCKSIENGRDKLCTLEVLPNGVILMREVRYAGEIRNSDEVPTRGSKALVKPKELELGLHLANKMTISSDKIHELDSEFNQNLEDIISKKAIIRPKDQTTLANEANLEELLKASLG